MYLQKRVMAIDYGDARTGIAISDALGMLAGEAFTIRQYDPVALADEICRLASDRNVGRLVLGYPKNMNSTIGERALKSEALAKMLSEKSGLEVILWDERRTTADAHRILNEVNTRGKKRKDTVDAVAASLILEGYLSSVSNP